jgi:hypothetical protein
MERMGAYQRMKKIILAVLFFLWSIPAFAQGFQSQSGIYYVTGYGAKCDGTIIYTGVQTTSGSKVISTPAHSFTSADVGAIITITNPAPINSYAAPSNVFVGTIASVAGGNATLNANVTFTSTTYQYASARWYHTVDTTAIQNALNAAYAANGGEIIFPTGVCVSGNLTFYSNERIKGASDGASVIMLANGSNSDLFTSYQFSSLVGTNSTGGAGNWAFEDIQLDGNRGANTGSGAGTPTGTGDGIRVYGYKWNWKNLFIDYFAADGMYSEWSDSGGSPFDNTNNAGPDGMEATGGYNFNGFYNAGYCLVWNGPHDSQVDQMFCSANGLGDILYGSGANASNGGPFHIFKFHGYNSGGVNIDVENDAIECTSCSEEQGVLINSLFNSFQFNNIATLTIGKSSGGVNPIYDLSFISNGVNLIVNNTGSGNGDQWIANSVNSISGGNIGSYQPQYSSENKGIPNTVGSTLSLQNGSSQIVTLSVDAGSYTYLTDAQRNMVMTPNGAFSFGPNAGNPTAGTVLDLSAGVGASQSSILLPADTTANRPTTPAPGMIRYNTTTNAFEVYEGASPSWVSLGGGVSCGAGTVNLTTEVVTNGIVTHC